MVNVLYLKFKVPNATWLLQIKPNSASSLVEYLKDGCQEVEPVFSQWCPVAR